MASLRLQTYHRLEFGNKKWDLTSSLHVMPDGTQYLKLPTTCYGFKQIVLANNEHLDDMPEGVTMRQSIGLDVLTKARNAAQAQQMAAPPQPTGLFANAVQADEQSCVVRKSKKRSHFQATEERAMRAVIPITIPVYMDNAEQRVQVLRPVHPSDVLAMPFDMPSLVAVIKYIRWAGFDSEVSPKRARHTTAPGVWHVKDGRKKAYVIKKEGKYKGFETHEDAEHAALGGIDERASADGSDAEIAAGSDEDIAAGSDAE
jgi:hypothetical protein